MGSKKLAQEDQSKLMEDLKDVISRTIYNHMNKDCPDTNTPEDVKKREEYWENALNTLFSDEFLREYLEYEFGDEVVGLK